MINCYFCQRPQGNVPVYPLGEGEVACLDCKRQYDQAENAQEPLVRIAVALEGLRDLLETVVQRASVTDPVSRN